LGTSQKRNLPAAGPVPKRGKNDQWRPKRVGGKSIKLNRSNLSRRRPEKKNANNKITKQEPENEWVQNNHDPFIRGQSPRFIRVPLTANGHSLIQTLVLNHNKGQEKHNQTDLRNMENRTRKRLLLSKHVKKNRENYINQDQEERQWEVQTKGEGNGCRRKKKMEARSK